MDKPDKKHLQSSKYVEQPLVSILMPVYNSMVDFARSNEKELLPKSIESLLNQSYRNFEILILDNQSTDTTPDICKTYASKDSRIKYILDVQKRFPEGAISHLASIMKGKFCTIANDDDLWSHEFLKRTVEFLISHPEADMAYSNAISVDTSGSLQERLVWRKEDAYSLTVSNLSNYCVYVQKRNVIPIIFGVFKAETFRKILPFEPFDELKANVDNLFIAKFFLLGCKCEFIDEELFFYRNKNRYIDPLKIPDMPSLDKPFSIWLYYVQHQLKFYNKLVHLISTIDFSEMQSVYLKCVTFHAFVLHSLNLLRWLWNDKYIRDKRAYFNLVRFIDKTLQPLLSDFEGMGLFPNDHTDNIRFEPFIVAGLIERTLEKISVFAELISLSRNVLEDKVGEDLLNYLEESLRTNTLFFHEQQSLVTAYSQKILPIMNKNNYQFRQIDGVNNNASPKVSILAYSTDNGEFLEETIFSIANQSFHDYELVIIVGDLNGETLKIIKKYPQIKWVSEKVGRYYSHLKKGTTLAKGEYIIIMHANDCLSTGWIQRCVNLLDANQDVSLVWGFPQYITTDGGVKDILYRQFYQSLPSQMYEWFEYWLNTGVAFPERNFCVRKEVINNCLPADCGNELDLYLEFNYMFNLKGYLPYHIPVVASYLKTDNSPFMKNSRENFGGNNKAKKYLKKIRKYKWSIMLGLKKHVFRDGRGQPLSYTLPVYKIRRTFYGFLYRMKPIIKIFLRECFKFKGSSIRSILHLRP